MSPNKEQILQSTKSGKFESQRIEIAVFIHFQCSKTKVPISCTIFWVLFLAHQLLYLRLMNPLYGQCRYIVTKNHEVTGIELQWLNPCLKTLQWKSTAFDITEDANKHILGNYLKSSNQSYYINFTEFKHLLQLPFHFELHLLICNELLSRVRNHE